MLNQSAVYQPRPVDSKTLKIILADRPKVQNAFNYYWDELVANGITKKNWCDTKHEEYATYDNAFGRTYVDRMKNIDVLIACELIRWADQNSNRLIPQHDLDFVQTVEHRAQSDTYNKTTKANHRDKWRLMMILLDCN